MYTNNTSQVLISATYIEMCVLTYIIVKVTVRSRLLRATKSASHNIIIFFRFGVSSFFNYLL